MRIAALTISGLDPSGGAGIAADLRAFAASGAWGLCVCSAITVQSTQGVRSVHPVAAPLVTAQAAEVLADARVGAIKTGALGSAANVRAVATLLDAWPQIPAVVDPVMVPSRGAGARLDGRGAVGALRDLARRAALLTPNLPEAAALLETTLLSDADARDAARALVSAGARAALVKGGHATGEQAIDWLALRGGRVVRLARARRALPPIHGTGCTLASLIAGRLAMRRSRGLAASQPSDAELVAAVRWARSRLDALLASPQVVGAGLCVLGAARPPRSLTS